LNIGDDILNDSNDNIQLPDCCIAPTDADIVENIYDDSIQNKEFNKMAKCAILSARNADVDEINKRVVGLLDTFEERIYTVGLSYILRVEPKKVSGPGTEKAGLSLQGALNRLSPHAALASVRR